MKNHSLVLTGLLLASGTAFAQSQLPTIEVRGSAYPDSNAALSFTCGNLSEPKPADVESVLEINDPTQTKLLTQKMMEAVAEACTANIPLIVVSRGKDGKSVSWKAGDVEPR